MFVLSKHPHAAIKSVDTSKALSMPGVAGYIDHTHIPGDNKDPFAIDEVSYFIDAHGNSARPNPGESHCSINTVIGAVPGTTNRSHSSREQGTSQTGIKVRHSRV